jgi:membrane-anchored protein YejM (alkaline phosphatase superfamily)
LTGLTSHMDVAPTLLKLMGVGNPPEDYCLGVDLLGDKHHAYVIACGWDSVAYIDNQYKAILSTSAYGAGRQRVTDNNDAEIANPSVFFENHRTVMADILRQMTRFRTGKAR